MTNIAIIIGKKNSVGLPGKNLMRFNGIPSAEYAFKNARRSQHISHIYVSTDSEEIIEIAKSYDAVVIRRPDHLALPSSLTEDVLKHALLEINKTIATEKIGTISLFFCNNPLTDLSTLDEAVSFLLSHPEYDSCVSVAKYDMFSPLRAKRIDSQGQLVPYCDGLAGNSLRDSSEPTYFIDFGIQVLRPSCIENMDSGISPFKWHGQRVKPFVVPFGFDIDAEWQVPAVQYWLNKVGGHDAR